jgi:hypothetical protein
MKTMNLQRPVALCLVVLPLGGIFVADFLAGRLWAHASTPGVSLETSSALLDVLMPLQDVVIPVLVLLTVLAAINAFLSLRRRDHMKAAEPVAPHEPPPSLAAGDSAAWEGGGR